MSDPEQRRALFFSSLSPGYIAGGSQCTLAFLQAVSDMHGGRLRYVGPAYLEDSPHDELDRIDARFVPNRSAAAKLWDVATRLSVDRTGPIAEQELSAQDPSDCVVYVNGEAAAQCARIAAARGFRTIFIPHNYPDEYAAARQSGIAERFRTRLVQHHALRAFAAASVTLTLTRQDLERFQAAHSGPPHGRGRPDMYFGYRAPEQAFDPQDMANDRPFNILLNTNFGLAENERGVLEFLEAIWPQVADSIPARLILAGRAPGETLKSVVAGLGERVTLFERPDHDEMAAIFARASVSVASTREGSGIKLRVAEALRRGLPVVTTEHCARGYEGVSPDVVRVYETPGDAVSAVLDIYAARAELGILARAEYQRLFSYEAGVAKMAAACGDQAP